MGKREICFESRPGFVYHRKYLPQFHVVGKYAYFCDQLLSRNGDLLGCFGIIARCCVIYLILDLIKEDFNWHVHIIYRVYFYIVLMEIIA